MKFYSKEEDKVLSEVFVFLWRDEIDKAIELMGRLLNEPDKTHLSLREYDDKSNVKRELTFSVYRGNNMEELTEKEREIILNNKRLFRVK